MSLRRNKLLLQRLAVSGCAAASLASPAFGQESADVPDAAVEAQLAAFEVPEGFELNLFASDPMIAKPVQMNWDSRGRLWVVSSAIYPHIEPGQSEGDKVLVLEDHDGDGTADSAAVFADDLHIPTGIMPAEGGAYVANSTQLLFLKDEDGDGRADSRRVVLSGFGTEDTHHLLHTLRWGPDGMLYFNQSIYIHSHVETPYGIRRLLGGGIWSFRPETRQLEVLCKGLINPWGFVFDRWGQNFATDGAGFEGINFVFPGAVFRTSPGAVRVLPGLNPGQPKHCGLEVVSGRHFPEEWQGSLVAPDFRGNRVNRFDLTQSGSSYLSTQRADVLASTHRAFRPIDVKMGPDGALYIADWYNPIIQHGEVDFRDPRRDHVHGRIWRLTVKGRDLVARPEIAGASVENLLEFLKAPEQWTRDQAKKELKERGADVVVPILAGWVENLDASDAEFEHHLLEALWTYQSLNLLNADLTRRLAAAGDYRARAAALRVLYHRWNEMEDAAALLLRAVQDEHALVRLWAVTVLSQWKTPEAIAIALMVLDREMDETLDFALWSALRDNERVWLPAFERGELTLKGGLKHAVFATRAVGSNASLPQVLAAMESGKAADDELADWIDFVGEAGDPTQLERLFGMVSGSQPVLGDSRRRAAALRALAEAGRLRKVVPQGDAARLAVMLDDQDEEIARAAAALASVWRSQSSQETLLEKLKANDGSDLMLQEIAAALGSMPGVGNETAFGELAGPGQPYRLRAMAAIGALALKPQLGAQLAVEVLRDAPDGKDAYGILDSVFSRKQGPAIFAAAVKGKTLPQEVALLAMQKARSSGLAVDPLVAALEEAGNLKPMVPTLTQNEMEALIDKVARLGNAARGESVYRRRELQCTLCHAIGETGGLVGPNLVSIGASAPVDYLIESLLDPNKIIKEGFHMTLLTTGDGQSYSGALVREDGSEVVIRDAAGVEHRVAASDVAQKVISPVSMMPVGLTASLREDEFVDLVRFLSELGKEGAFKTQPNLFVRHWKVLQPQERFRDDMGFYGLKMFAGDDPGFEWIPVYSTVDGALPLEDLPTIAGRKPGQPGQVLFGVTRFAVDVSKPGTVLMKLDDPAGLRIWQDGDELEIQSQMVLEMEEGSHRFTLTVEREARTRGIRIEFVETGPDGARVSVMAGP